MPACSLAILNFLMASSAQAEGFTFRRIGVPQAGSHHRIDVQIDQEAPVSVAHTSRRQEGSLKRHTRTGAAHPAGVEWFWDGVSPLLADAQPDRFRQAALVLASAPESSIEAPRLQTLRWIAQAYGPIILRETAGTRVSPALALAVIAVESAGQSNALSPAGAAGLMQLMPVTAARFGVTDRLQAAENIRGGVAYLSWLMGRFEGDPILALAAYNAGEGAVDNNGGVPPFPETRAYVPKVLAAWALARTLCNAPSNTSGEDCLPATDAL